VAGSVVLSLGLLGCDASSFSPSASEGGGSVPPRTDGLASKLSFVEVAAEIGIDFEHRSGSNGSFPMPAIMAGGLAVFDSDGDGALDVYLVDGGERFPSDGGEGGAPNRLYRQQEDGRFVDATEASGLGDLGYGMGAAVGDIDNDGDLDLFVSNWGRDSLYRNRGDGSFEDISQRAGLSEGGFSSSAVFCELTGDDLLDLYVTRYVDFDPDRVCAAEGGRVDYCGPTHFEGLPDRLYRNRGDGRFEEISAKAGIGAVADAGLGVVCLDFDGDGLSDVYVANDADPNHLWMNRGDGTFVDDAVLVGLAFNRYGVAEAGMGVTAADSDGDNDLDVFVTHLIEESNTWYENRGLAGFDDATALTGLGPASVPFTSFGTAFGDFDLDGDLDLGVVGGGVKKRPSFASDRADWFWRGYAEPNLFFENVGDGRFEEIGAQLGAWAEPVEVSRSLVAADLDADGDLDLVSSQIEGPAQVWRNDTSERVGSWLAIRAIDPQAGDRDAIGARVRVFAGGASRLAWVSVSDGYLSSKPAEVHFGLGDAASVDRIEVTWPGADVESFEGGPVGRRLVLRRGEGTPVQ
jgi:hypothetical protein